MDVVPLKTRLKINAVHLLAASIGWRMKAPGRLRIFAFHDINDDAGDLWAVTKRQFAGYLSLLKDEGYVTLRAGDLLAGWPSVLSRERVVLLTFDDGYAAQGDVAAEMLNRRGMTATFFAVSSFVGRCRSRRVFSGKERDFLGGEDLRQLDRAGFEIGSHSHAHPLLGVVSQERAARELAVSKQILERELGHSIASFAYPYGRRNAYSPKTRAVLRENGYSTGFTMQGVGVEPHCDLLRLPRTDISRFDTPATFRRKLQGHYDLIGKARRCGTNA